MPANLCPQVSVLDISGHLSVSIAGTGSGSASVNFKKDSKFSSVEVTSSVKTNTKLPTICAAMVVTDQPPDVADMRQCMTEWREIEGGASAA